MKKQITICVLWDVLFIIYLYGNAQISYFLKIYVGRTMNTYPTLWVHISLMMLCGGIILLLFYVGSKYQRTVKSAAAEFLTIGIPAIYLTTAFLIPMVFSIVGVDNIRVYTPMWMIYDLRVMDLSSIVLGYELILFITRLIQIRRAAKFAVAENTHE